MNSCRPNRPPWRLTSVALVLSVALLIGPPAGGQDDQTSNTQTVQVVNVSRGDVLRIADGDDERVVMLYGVTSPEPHTPVGAQAKKLTQQLIGDRSVDVSVRFQQPSVDYVEVHLDDGRVLNHQLLLAGLGKLDAVTAIGDETYAALEERARADEIGVWKPEEETAEGVEGEAEAVTLTDKDPDLTPSERFRQLKELEQEVEFAVALEHWRGLTEAQKASVRESAVERAAIRADRAEEDYQTLAEEYETVSGELARIEAEIEAKQTELEEYGPLALQEAILELYEADPHLVGLEQDLTQAEEAAAIAMNDFGGGSTQYLDALGDIDSAEDLVEAQRQALALEEEDLRLRFAQKRELIENELDVLQAGRQDILQEFNTMETEFNNAAAALDIRDQQRSQNLATLEALEEAAANENYESGLEKQEIAAWKGTGDAETPVFEVKRDLWVLDYDAGDSAGERALQMTVRRVSDDAVVRQIVDNGPLHQSFVVLKERGSLYVEVIAPPDVSWEITATGYARE